MHSGFAICMKEGARMDRWNWHYRLRVRFRWPFVHKVLDRKLVNWHSALGRSRSMVGVRHD